MLLSHMMANMEELTQGKDHTQQPQLWVENKFEALKQVDPDVRILLMHTKVRYHELKHKLQNQNLLIQMMQRLKNDGVSDEPELEVEDISEECQNQKTALEDSLNNIELLADEAESLYTGYKEKKTKLSVYLKEVEEEKASVNSLDVEIADKRAQIEQLRQSLLPNLKSEVSSLQQQTPHLEEENDNLRQQTTHVAESQTDLQQTQSRIQGYEATIKILQQLSGIQEWSLDDNILNVQVKNVYNNELLRMKIIFLRSVGGGAILHKVELNREDIDLASVIKVAVARNDVRLLLMEVHKHCQQKLPLVEEINKIRHRFAIDWIEASGVLRVLFAQATIVCTLQLNPSYPLQNSITLSKIEDSTNQHDLSLLKPSQPTPSLTEWLEYLNENFAPEPSTDR